MVNLPQRKTRFYEALAPSAPSMRQTLLQPDEFLPVLEKTQLLPELDGKVRPLAAAAGGAPSGQSRQLRVFVSC